ncbi:RNA-binding S4 domain-containing protein [Rhodococcus sp. X156]|uniref:RNA-binding S4 domain-containing protein n=1 Tax=Rhodococcus sp. X156 TaxID=2499145 RepID=UPI000FD9FAAC|nr:RNA-binding S4 domain-containing protein [Rhodococcus sp. X156]
MAEAATVRVDAWLWAVRITKTRSLAAAQCKGGHVRVNGSSAKPAQLVKPGDEVRVRAGGLERILVVRRCINKRVSATVAAECLTDNSPPPPPKELAAPPLQRDRGAGRPTKRDRRLIDRLRERGWQPPEE